MNGLIFRENTMDLDEKQVLAYLVRFTRNKPEELAESLLDSFGSLKGVLEARPEALMRVSGVGQKTADLISAFLPVVRIWQRLNQTEPEKISNSRECFAYCKSLVSGLRNEEFWIICLNAQCRVLGKRRISVGSLSEVSAYPRKLMETALNYNAHSIILCHNHPGGTCAPSMEDLQSTHLIKKMMNSVQIILLDHVIVANDCTYSMIEHGDIDYRESKMR